MPHTPGRKVPGVRPPLWTVLCLLACGAEATAAPPAVPARPSDLAGHHKAQGHDEQAASGHSPTALRGQQPSPPADAGTPRATLPAVNMEGSDGGPAAADGGVAEVPAAEPPPLVHPVLLQLPGPQALAGFHGALQRAARGEGKARLLFYGASHTASDLYTHVIRKRLQERFGEGGPGFVLPAKPWRWYRHGNFRFDRNRGFEDMRVKASHPKDEAYGLAGVALQSQRRYAVSAIETRGRAPLTGHVDAFDLYYMRQPDGGRLVVFIDGERVRSLSTRGKTRAAAYARFQVQPGPHRFEMRAQANGPVRVFGLVAERGSAGVVVDTLGIPGARARYHLHWDDSIYREHLARRSPDLVVLAYGTNEAGDDDVPIERYRSRLDKVLSRIRETVPQASCVLVGPSDRPLRQEDESYLDRPRTVMINTQQRDAALTHGCAFFDVLAFMGGPMSMLRWVAAEPPFGSPDHVHYTRRGYEALGEALHEALMDGFAGPEQPTQ